MAGLQHQQSYDSNLSTSPPVEPVGYNWIKDTKAHKQSGSSSGMSIEILAAIGLKVFCGFNKGSIVSLIHGNKLQNEIVCIILFLIKTYSMTMYRF